MSLQYPPALVLFISFSFQMCATRGGFWRRWKSLAGSTGSTRPSSEGLFWPVKTRRPEVLLIDQETWWILSTLCSELQVSPFSETNRSSPWIRFCACLRMSYRGLTCSLTCSASPLTPSTPPKHTLVLADRHLLDAGFGLCSPRTNTVTQTRFLWAFLAFNPQPLMLFWSHFCWFNCRRTVEVMFQTIKWHSWSFWLTHYVSLYEGKYAVSNRNCCGNQFLISFLLSSPFKLVSQQKKLLLQLISLARGQRQWLALLFWGIFCLTWQICAFEFKNRMRSMCEADMHDQVVCSVILDCVSGH